MAKIKICGITSLETVDVLNKVKPDYIGFVFAESKRQIGLDVASNIVDKLDPSIKKVGVFVDYDAYELIKLVEEKFIDVVQLHGGENEHYIKALKKFIDCPIVKAVKVDGNKIVSAVPPSADYVLLDTYSKDMAGGVGKAFDWSTFDFSEIKKPLFLAGGVNLDNIDNALQYNPYAIDISSGVETDGKKDAQKIEKIMDIIRKKA